MIPPIKMHELKYEIRRLKDKKAPGFDLITAEVLKRLPNKGLAKLLRLMNKTISLEYVPSVWKVADVIMIPKPGKDPHEVSSYRPISLLPSTSKLFERLIFKRLKPIVESRNLIPNHQFGFRSKHSTIEQVHRITTEIERALEEKKVCSAIFLDVAQAFDRVWHEGLLNKLKVYLPEQFFHLMESYLTSRYFRIKQENYYSKLVQIEAGVPQGSVLGPLLYLLYTKDLPTMPYTKTATFADDTAVLAVGDTTLESTQKLQAATDQIIRWTQRWRIKLNSSKSVHIDFTNKSISYSPIAISGTTIPYANTAKYLGMTLDAKLRWKEHIKIKRLELDIKWRKLEWLIGRKSGLSINNKILLYNQILKPVWNYGAQLWGCASQTNIAVIQRFQNKVLRSIVNAPWYIRNSDLHRDLGIPTVLEEINSRAKAHEKRLQEHINEEATILLNVYGVRRLQRIRPSDLARQL